MTKREMTPKGNNSLYDREFEELWKLYPRKQGRSDARKAYIFARRSGVAEETVRRGVEAYVRYVEARGTDPRYVKQGGNWFFSRCWEDAEALEKAAAAPLQRSAPPRRSADYNPALDYPQKRYTRAELKKLGISFRDEDDDE